MKDQTSYFAQGCETKQKNPTYKTQYKLKYNSLDFEMVIKI